jgi:hypothetical protein
VESVMHALNAVMVVANTNLNSRSIQTDCNITPMSGCKEILELKFDSSKCLIYLANKNVLHKT